MTGVSRWLLRRALPGDVRESIVVELDAEFERRLFSPATRDGAAWWYRRQVAGSLLPAAAMRARRLSRLAADAQQDARLALRVLARQKTFTAVAVISLALGTGFATTIFSVFDAVFLRPLPFHDGASLARVWSANPRGITRGDVSPPDFFDWRDQARSMTLAAFAETNATVTGSGEPMKVPAAYGTANLAATLALPPIAGRWFASDDTAAGGQPVIVLGEQFWRTRFGAAADVLGRTILVDGAARTVIGVVPADFRLSGAPGLWLPMPDVWRRGESRSARYLSAVGRLGPGISAAAAFDELSAIARRLDEAYPVSNKGWGVTVVPLREAMFGEVHRPVLMLLAAVSAVLLIACANVAGLMLARGAARTREFAVRAAIGASRSRLLRQQLVETSVIVLLGGAGGLLGASWLLDILPADPRLSALFDRVHLDLRVLVVAAAATLVSAAASGLAPAWYASRQPDRTALGGGSRSTGAHVRIRRVIVVAQIAVATALVAGGLLLDRSLAHLTAVPAGFAADRTLVVDVSLPSSAYPPSQRAPFFERVLERIRALPGVEEAGAGGPLPLSGREGMLRFGAIHDRWRDGDLPARAYVRWATTGYFAAMGIPVRAGRPIDSTDTALSHPVIVIDDQLARTLFGSDSPIGRRMQLSMERGVWREIVGLVGAVHQISLDRGFDPHAYVPQAQMPSPALTIVVRGSRDPRDTLGDVRAIVRGTAPDLPLGTAGSLDGLRDDSVATRRLNVELLGAFAASALLLTMVGVYGVMSQIVTQSTRELGIRLALGASATGIVALTLRRAAWMAVAGVAAGSALAAAATPALGAMLYGIGPHDPLVLAASILLLAATALAAAYIPARRVRRLDVVNVLRDA